MKRNDLQQLTAIRLREASALLGTGHHEGAYYLGGYAAECSLKACIAKRTERHDFPDKRRATASHTHRIVDLARVAGLEDLLVEAMKRDPVFAANWRIVQNWSEQSRYERPVKAEAESLLSALKDRKHGVLRWLRGHW